MASSEEINKLRRLYEAMGGDIELFSRVMCWQDIDEVPDFHRDIYGVITGNERVAMAAPRGFAKSTIVSKVYPLWLILYKKRRDICIISASETLAVEHLRYIKTHLESNPKVLAGWGNLKSEKWTENHFIVNHPDGTRINVRAKGAGGQIRGFRPDCLILDDIETDDSVESEDQRRKIKNWLFKACLNTLLPGGQLLLIGTLIHPLSVLSDLLDMPNNWVKRKYQAYKDGVEAVGHELWPEKRPHDWLQARKAEIGSWAFAAEFMNDPKMDASMPIKDDHIRYWDSLPNDLSMVIAVDPAYSEEDNADFKVASLIGIDANHNRYLVDYVRTHATSGEFIDAILSMYLRHKNTITGVGVPNSGTEKEFFRSCVNKAHDRKIYPPFAELKNSFISSTGGSVRNKKDRIIAALQPLFEQGKYYIHANHIDAREELLTIGSSRWDDVVDTMAYAEQIITPGYAKVEKEDDYLYPEPVLSGSYGIEY